MAFLQVENLTVSYGDEDHRITVLDKVSLEGNVGEVIVILGASGSGKSTLLSAIAGFVKYSGTIQLKTPCQPAYVFQDSYMVEFLNVQENLELPQVLKGQKQNNCRIDKLAKDMGLSRTDKRVSEISGGERERVGIVRAVSTFSPLILMDEPTGSLDSVTGKRVEKLISDIKDQHLIIVATHDRKMATNIGDQIYEIIDQKLVLKQKRSRKRDGYCCRTNDDIGIIRYTDALQISLKMLKKKAVKTTFSSTVLSLALAFVFIILTVCLNSNSALTKMSDDYFGKTLTSVSLVERTVVADSFELVRSIRPNRQDLENLNLKILPSFRGILPASLTLKTSETSLPVLFSPSICENSKLQSGRCPIAYDEVIVNTSYQEANIVSSIGYTAFLTIDSSVNKRISSDKIKLEILGKVVGVSKETKAFNIPTIYYDHEAMTQHLKSIKLPNASTIFATNVTLYDRIDRLCSDTDKLSGYAYIVHDMNPEGLKNILNDPYELDNRALEMKEVTGEVVQSMGLVAFIFLMMTVSSAVMLEFITILSVYEEERKTLALCKSLGISDRGFKRLANGMAVVLLTVVTVLTLSLMVMLQSLGYFVTNSLGLADFFLPSFFLEKVALIFLFNTVMAFMISSVSIKKIINNDLMNTLKGE